MRNRLRSGLFAVLATIVVGTVGAGVCPTEPPLENHTGGGTVGCTCFVPGEEAGAIFNLPIADFPIQILKVGIGWGSAATGQPDSLEQAFHIYATGLPNPGAPVFSQVGPVLTDGVINLFDVEIVEPVILSSGPFMVSLEFANSNVGGGAFTPTIVHDGAGCQFGKNSVFAIPPEAWVDACLLGVTGNWVFVVEYRKINCGASGPGAVPDGGLVPGVPLVLDRDAGGALELFWSGSCSASDETYSVYEGTLGSFTSHLPKTCDTGSTTATVSPAIGDTYYLVVPRDSTNEGSYGTDSAGAPRSPAIATCRPPVAGTCP